MFNCWLVVAHRTFYCSCVTLKEEQLQKWHQLFCISRTSGHLPPLEATSGALKLQGEAPLPSFYWVNRSVYCSGTRRMFSGTVKSISGYVPAKLHWIPPLYKSLSMRRGGKLNYWRKYVALCLNWRQHAPFQLLPAGHWQNNWQTS